jgi:hypothetical protein
LSPPTRRSQPAARADDVAHAHRDRRHREGVDRAVEPRERLHPRHAARGVELLAHVGAGREGPLAGGGEHEDADALVGRQLGERLEHRVEEAGVHGVAPLGTVEAQDGDAVVLGTLQGWHAPRF